MHFSLFLSRRLYSLRHLVLRLPTLRLFQPLTRSPFHQERASSFLSSSVSSPSSSLSSLCLFPHNPYCLPGRHEYYVIMQSRGACDVVACSVYSVYVYACMCVYVCVHHALHLLEGEMGELVLIEEVGKLCEILSLLRREIGLIILLRKRKRRYLNWLLRKRERERE